MADMITGVVKWFSAEKGFGFITSAERGDLYVHARSLEDGRTALSPGEPVYFTARETPRGLEAAQVRVGAPPPPPKPAQPTIELAPAGAPAKASLKLVVRPIDPRPLTRAGKRRPSVVAFMVDLDAAAFAALPASLPRAAAPSACLVLIPAKAWERCGSAWQADPDGALAISGMLTLNPLVPDMLTLYASHAETLEAQSAGKQAQARARATPLDAGEA